MKEIVSIRIDSLWRMLALDKEGYLPGIDNEGATGEFDNKGAIFVPGGIVLKDSDRDPIIKEPYGFLTPERFRSLVREAMKFDNTTLLYHDGIAKGINLSNGIFAEMSADILANLKAAQQNYSDPLEDEPPAKINSTHIAKSYCPTYIEQPYGSRTRLSSSLAVCLLQPRMYHLRCREKFGLYGDRDQLVWNGIKSAKRPILTENGVILAQPHIVVCHNTRYKKETFSGITRILGYGKFGEFANFSLEEITDELLQECNRKKPTEKEIVAEYEERKVVAVLRIYPSTNPNWRELNYTTSLISPENDLGINVDEITEKAKERYNVK